MPANENQCLRCGKCCEVLILPKTMEEIQSIAQFDKPSSDYAFAARNFRQITKEEALAKNPYLKTWEILAPGYSSLPPRYYYTCRRFDPLSKTCAVYSARPITCSGYPFYSNAYVYPHSFYSKDCGFNRDENIHPEILKLIKRGKKK